MDETLIIITLLSIKHFIVDFILQRPYQWKNKGTYGHFGGLLHAGLHGIGTCLCFVFFTPENFIWLALIDSVLHYHIDWVKENLTRKYGWKADKDEEFWWLLGFDQFLHMMTYVLLVFLSLK